MQLDRTRIIFLAILGVTAVVICGALAGILTCTTWLLASFGSPTPPELITVTPAQLAAQAEQMGGAPIDDRSFVGGPAIRIPAGDGSAALRLPGSLPWKGARFLTVDALVDGEHTGEVSFRFFAAGETEARVTVSLGVFPGLRTRLSVPLSALDAEAVFLPRTPGRFKGRVRGRRLSPDQIDQVRIHLRETASAQSLYLGALTLTAEEPRYPVPRRPLVDGLGQWRDREWEGKTTSDAFLGTWLTVALEEDRDATYPKAWCERGGLADKAFKATGFFRVEERDGRWWAFDPLGRGFVPLGVDHRDHPGLHDDISRLHRELLGEIGPTGDLDGLGDDAALARRLREPGANPEQQQAVYRQEETCIQLLKENGIVIIPGASCDNESQQVQDQLREILAVNEHAARQRFAQYDAR